MENLELSMFIDKLSHPFNCDELSMCHSNDTYGLPGGAFLANLLNLDYRISLAHFN